MTTQHRYYGILGDDLVVVPFLRSGMRHCHRFGRHAASRMRGLRGGFAPVAKSIAPAAANTPLASPSPAAGLSQRLCAGCKIHCTGCGKYPPRFAESSCGAFPSVSHCQTSPHKFWNVTKTQGFLRAKTLQTFVTLRAQPGCSRLPKLLLGSVDIAIASAGTPHPNSAKREGDLPRYGFCKLKNEMTVDDADNYVWFCKLKNCEYALRVKMP